MAKQVIKLSTQEELKIFMSPQRQKLIKLMRINGEAMTPKAIADLLGVSPSSAQFHIKKLQSIGVVELDHTEIINGIYAKYYKLAVADIRIGSLVEENLADERYTIMQNLAKDTFDGLVGMCESGFSDDVLKDHGDFLNGVIHLTKEDSIELLELIRNYITKHEKKGKDTCAWEYTLMLYDTELAGKPKDISNHRDSLTGGGENSENEKV